MNEEAKRYLSEIGRRGGLSRSAKKLAASGKNLKLARKRKAAK